MPFVGGSNAKSSGFTETGDYDPRRYQYGGYEGGARDERANLASSQRDVEARTGPQIDKTAQNQTRGVQMGSLANLSAAANGSVPSKAEQLGQQMSDRALRGQVSAAGTTRGGPGAQAAAYRTASQNAATQRADMNQGIQAMRADEMATARGQLAQASTAARGQDIGLATDQARINQQQTALNDARAAQYESLQNKVATDQLNAGLAQQKIASDSRSAANQLNTQTAQHNADQDMNLFKGAVGALGGVAQGALSLFSDPASKVPLMGSLSSLDLGGTTPGGVDLGAGMTGRKINEASTGLAGNTGGIRGMVGGGGITGGGGVPGGFGGGMPSDMAGKYTPSDVTGKTGNVMLSPGEAKVPADLDAAMAEGRDDASPYERDPEVSRGISGAPRGYAGGVTRVPEPDDTSWSKPDSFGMKKGKTGEDKDFSKMAPGAEDWERYGASKDKEGDPNWKDGGATKPAEKKAPAWAQILSGGFGGLKDWAAPPVVYARDTTTSDPAAKKAAFEAGAAHATKAITGQDMEPWSKDEGNDKGDEKRDEKALGFSAKRDRDQDTGITDIGELPGFVPAPAPHPLPAPPPPPPSARAQTRARWDGPAAAPSRMRSDEKAKEPAATGGEPFDWEKHPQKSQLRDPGDFKRDTPAQQKAIGKAYHDRLGKEADDIMAGMKASLKRGASVSKYEGEADDERFAEMPDSAMAKAMRSMEASPYAYKEGLRPAEQTPGEVNVGPMANKMAEDPVARTAIVRDPETNLLAIDKDKGLKVVMGSLASLQDQIDDMRNDVPRAARAKKERRRGSSQP